MFCLVTSLNCGTDPTDCSLVKGGSVTKSKFLQTVCPSVSRFVSDYEVFVSAQEDLPTYLVDSLNEVNANLELGNTG